MKWLMMIILQFFLIQAENDDVVPIWNTAEFFEKLKERKVSCEYEHPKTGGHGFGLGSETEANGWIERAVTFWKKTMTVKIKPKWRKVLYETIRFADPAHGSSCN